MRSSLLFQGSRPAKPPAAHNDPIYIMLLGMSDNCFSQISLPHGRKDMEDTFPPGFILSHGDDLISRGLQLDPVRYHILTHPFRHYGQLAYMEQMYDRIVLFCQIRCKIDRLSCLLRSVNRHKDFFLVLIPPAAPS
jgi:hypothetical protein